MHELACPSCNAASQFDLKDYLLMCPFCSATFQLDLQNGRKDLYADHYIIPNTLDPRQLKGIVNVWLKRLHHTPDAVESEYFITDVQGYSIPFWVVSLEAHSSWKGLVKRQNRKKKKNEIFTTSSYISEQGSFRRNYRWAVSARRNICETWGMASLHEPKEDIGVEWDGFPLDSTFSRGRVDSTTGIKTSKESLEEELSAYDVREYFEFKYSNGLPILAIQVPEEEALRRTKQHVEFYHYKIAKLNIDIPIDIRTELEIAGIQLLHLPFWHIHYVYKPKSVLRHFQRSTVKNLMIEGYSGGVLKSELAIIHRDKLWINVIVSLTVCILMAFLGIFWHTSFFLVSIFFLIVSGVSGYIASVRAAHATNEASSFFHAADEDQDNLKLQGASAINTQT